MTDKALYSNDLIHRYPSHTFSDGPSHSQFQVALYEVALPVSQPQQLIGKASLSS